MWPFQLSQRISNEFYQLLPITGINFRTLPKPFRGFPRFDLKKDPNPDQNYNKSYDDVENGISEISQLIFTSKGSGSVLMDQQAELTIKMGPFEMKESIPFTPEFYSADKIEIIIR